MFIHLKLILEMPASEGGAAQTLYSPWRFGKTGRAGTEAEGDEQGLELSPSKLGLIYSHLSPAAVSAVLRSLPAVLRAGCGRCLGCHGQAHVTHACLRARACARSRQVSPAHSTDSSERSVVIVAGEERELCMHNTLMGLKVPAAPDAPVHAVRPHL